MSPSTSILHPPDDEDCVIRFKEDANSFVQTDLGFEAQIKQDDDEHRLHLNLVRSIFIEQTTRLSLVGPENTRVAKRITVPFTFKKPPRPSPPMRVPVKPNNGQPTPGFRGSRSSPYSPQFPSQREHFDSRSPVTYALQHREQQGASLKSMNLHEDLDSAPFKEDADEEILNRQSLKLLSVKCLKKNRKKRLMVAVN